jgi:hypothetical protein
VGKGHPELSSTFGRLRASCAMDNGVVGMMARHWRRRLRLIRYAGGTRLEDVNQALFNMNSVTMVHITKKNELAMDASFIKSL